MLRPYVTRVIIANPQVKAIASSVLASLHAPGFLPEVWLPNVETYRLRRLVARCNQAVRPHTRVKS